MSFPVAVSVWWLLPDYPHNTQAWYLSEKDKELALQRAANNGKANITGIMDIKLVIRMFGSWRWWVLCIMYIFVRDNLPTILMHYAKSFGQTVRKLVSSQQLLCHLSP